MPQFEPPPVEPKPAYATLKDVAVRGASLRRAIEMIAASGGLSVEFAPNMPEVTVDLDYRQMTPVAMLRDLGQRHGFTAFEQEEGKVLVIPAVDTAGIAPDPTYNDEQPQG
jgi:hypothetical protein